MRIHWYWPFARREELDWAFGTARAEDSILVQVIRRDEAPEEGEHGRVRVVQDLPDVERGEQGRLRWVVSRANTYRSRSSARRRQWHAQPFDLVHLHYVNRFTDAFGRLPHPLVMSVHDVVPHVPRLGRVEHALLDRLYRRADGLVVHHRRLADQLVADFDVGADKVHIVPHQVFPVGEVPPLDESAGPMVLFFGSLRPNKGVEVLAAALDKVTSPDVRVVIAGRGDAAIEEVARGLARRDARVSVEIGFATLERKRELFGQASVVVLPYTSFSSQSGVLHDAYGHGRPVVVTDVGALGDSVREDGTGWVVPPGDPAELAEAIRASLEGPERLARGTAARRIAIERSPANVGRRLREVYDELVVS